MTKNVLGGRKLVGPGYMIYFQFCSKLFVFFVFFLFHMHLKFYIGAKYHKMYVSVTANTLEDLKAKLKHLFFFFVFF